MLSLPLLCKNVCGCLRSMSWARTRSSGHHKVSRNDNLWEIGCLRLITIRNSVVNGLICWIRGMFFKLHGVTFDYKFLFYLDLWPERLVEGIWRVNCHVNFAPRDLTRLFAVKKLPFWVDFRTILNEIRIFKPNFDLLVRHKKLILAGFHSQNCLLFIVVGTQTDSALMIELRNFNSILRFTGSA